VNTHKESAAAELFQFLFFFAVPFKYSENDTVETDQIAMKEEGEHDFHKRNTTQCHPKKLIILGNQL